MSSPRILLTACDTGTANYLLPVLPHLKLPNVIVAQAQAAEVLTREGIGFEAINHVHFDELLEQGQRVLESHKPDLILAGTSWGPSIDKAITLAARAAGIPTYAIVEHWALYAERFSRVQNDQLHDRFKYLPDHVIVNDTRALQEAVAAGIPEDQLLYLGQPHLEQIYKKYKHASNIKRNQEIVFISERIGSDLLTEDSAYNGFDEYEMLETLIRVCKKLERSLLIKLHPQEPADKYDSYLDGKRVRSTREYPLQKLLLESYKIVGMVSMVLLEAALFRNDIISLLPYESRAMFVGNRIGVTRHVSNASELETMLLETSAQQNVDSDEGWFGKQFIGSVERIAGFFESQALAG